MKCSVSSSLVDEWEMVVNIDCSILIRLRDVVWL